MPRKNKHRNALLKYIKQPKKSRALFGVFFGLVMTSLGLGLLFAATPNVEYIISPATDSGSANQTKTLSIVMKPSGNSVGSGNVKVTINSTQLQYVKFDKSADSNINFYAVSGNNGGISFAYSVNDPDKLKSSNTLGTLVVSVKSLSAAQTSQINYDPNYTLAFKTRSYSSLPVKTKNATINVQAIATPPAATPNNSTTTQPTPAPKNTTQQPPASTSPTTEAPPSTSPVDSTVPPDVGTSIESSIKSRGALSSSSKSFPGWILLVTGVLVSIAGGYYYWFIYRKTKHITAPKVNPIVPTGPLPSENITTNTTGVSDQPTPQLASLSETISPTHLAVTAKEATVPRSRVNEKEITPVTMSKKEQLEPPIVHDSPEKPQEFKLTTPPGMPTDIGNEDDMPDMFELAEKHPESFGSQELSEEAEKTKTNPKQ